MKYYSRSLQSKGTKHSPKPKNKTDSSPHKAIVLEELLHKSQDDYCITKPKSPLHTTPKGHCKKRQKRYLHTRPKWPLHTRRKWSSHTKPKWPCITKMTIAYNIKMTIAYQKKLPLHTKPKWQLYTKPNVCPRTTIWFCASHQIYQNVFNQR